jgi:hypothetical protein
MRYFFSKNIIKQKIYEIISHNILISKLLIKIGLKLKKNKFITLTHLHFDFTLQNYSGTIISKKNKFYQKSTISVRIRNSRYGFEVCYMPFNPFVRQKVLLTKLFDVQMG